MARSSYRFPCSATARIRPAAATPEASTTQRPCTVSRTAAPAGRPNAGPGSLDNIAQFFSSRKGSGSRPKLEIPVSTGATGFRSGQRVRHPKYGEGVVFRREGDGDDAKITVQFAEFGVKKLVEKFAQLEKV